MRRSNPSKPTTKTEGNGQAETIIGTIREQENDSPNCKDVSMRHGTAPSSKMKYLPYKPKRKTRAEAARQGLEPLAT